MRSAERMVSPVKFMTAPGSIEADLASALELVESHFPGLPLVGYESDDDLGLAEELGFKRVGRLCVWVRG